MKKNISNEKAFVENLFKHNKFKILINFYSFNKEFYLKIILRCKITYIFQIFYLELH